MFSPPKLLFIYALIPFFTILYPFYTLNISCIPHFVWLSDSYLAYTKACLMNFGNGAELTNGI